MTKVGQDSARQVYRREEARLWPLITLLQQKGSVASMTSLGVRSSLFCTTNGRIVVVHECIGSGDNSYCSFGQTYISGGLGTFRLAQ